MHPILALILANTIWGAGPPIFKLALTNIPPFTLAFTRFFIAGCIFLPLALRHKIRELSWNDWASIVVASFFGISLNIGFYFLGLQRADSINASVIASGAPIFGFFLSILFLHERARFRTSFGMLISFAGILLLVCAPLLSNGGGAASFSAWQGNIYYIVAMIGSVLFPLILKHVLNKVNIFVILCVGFFFAALTFFPFMLRELASWHYTQINAAGVFGVLYGTIFCSVIAYGLYYYGLARITAQEVGVFTYIDPVVTVFVAVPLLHEYPGRTYFAALFLVIFGIYISEGRVHYHPILRLRAALHKEKIDPKSPLINEL